MSAHVSSGTGSPPVSTSTNSSFEIRASIVIPSRPITMSSAFSINGCPGAPLA
jgi:hypothetical protein